MGRPRKYHPTPLALGQFRRDLSNPERVVTVESIRPGGLRARVRTVVQDTSPGGHGFVVAKGSRSSDMDAARLALWPEVQDTPAAGA